MDIDLLKTFLEVNATRHFGWAADNLYLTPAAVSARVRQLEHRLGVSLFLRSRNNIQLTPEGERLLPHAETLLLAWSRARQDVTLAPDQASRLTLGATEAFWHFAGRERLDALLGLLPELALRAESHPADGLARMLEERTLDLAFLLEPPTLEGFRADRIGQVRLVLVSTDESASVRTALEAGYVQVAWGVSFEQFHVRRFGDARVPALHTNRGALALDFLQRQRGEGRPAAAYLPQSLLEHPRGEGLNPVRGAPAFARPLYAVYRTAAERKGAIQALINAVKPLKI